MQTTESTPEKRQEPVPVPTISIPGNVLATVPGNVQKPVPAEKKNTSKLQRKKKVSVPEKEEKKLEEPVDDIAMWCVLRAMC